MEKANQRDRALRIVEQRAGFKPLEEQPRSQLVDDHAAAFYLATTRGTLSVWRSSGRVALPFVKVGRAVRYRCGDLMDFIERGAHHHTGKAAG